MVTKIIHPSISEKAFNCPHCEVLTTQSWYEIAAEKRGANAPVPGVLIPDIFERIDIEIDDAKKKNDLDKIEKLKDFRIYAERINTGQLFQEDSEIQYGIKKIGNLHISQCYSCEKFSVWVHKSLIFPANREGPVPNEYLSEDIRRDFDEARSIVNNSPRGAAALLRLCIQKLCISLGEPGKDLYEDIGSLVKKGLDKRIQQSLDIVRVIGNESVHPGEMNIHDDRDTVFQLFDLVNLIAEQMLTLPSNIQNLYEKLPKGKRDAIEIRDK